MALTSFLSEEVNRINKLTFQPRALGETIAVKSQEDMVFRFGLNLIKLLFVSGDRRVNSLLLHVS